MPSKTAVGPVPDVADLPQVAVQTNISSDQMPSKTMPNVFSEQINGLPATTTPASTPSPPTKSDVPQYLPAYQEFVCGWGASFTNIIITYPIYKVIFRQMLHGIRISTALNQLRKEGPMFLYRGLLPPLIQRTSTMSIMFGCYKEYGRIINQQFPLLSMPLKKMASGMCAGTTEALLTPLERVQVLLQHSKYHERFQNTAQAVRHLQPYGIKEYYRGNTAILLRNGPSTAMFFTLRRPLKEMLPGYDSYFSHYVRDFVSGALLGSMTSTLGYPINVIKTRMMSKIGGTHLSILQTFHIVFRERNRQWRLMFRGVQTNFTRSLISWGIINATYELLKKLITAHPHSP